jgi:two-component system, response regulator YesN
MGKRHVLLITMQTFRKLFISYSTLLVLPILVSVLVYTRVNSVITKEIGRTNQASITQMKRLLDEKLKGFYMTADQLSLDEKVKSLAAAGESVTPYQRLVMSDIQKLLVQFKIANPFIDEIYLYYPRSGYVLSNVSRYNGDDFAMIADYKFNMSMTEWENLMKSGGYRNLHLLEEKNSTSSRTFFFTQKFIFEGGGNTPVVFAILADGKLLAELLELLKWNDQGVLIISSSMGTIFSSNREDINPIQLEYSALRGQQGIIQELHSNEKYFIASIGSSVSDWQYTCIIPSKEYLKSLDFVRQITLVYTLICLTVGLALSFFLAMRNYTPIHQLTRMFVDRLGQTEGENINDFAFLEAALKELLQKNEKLESTIYRQKDTVQNDLLTQLIRGRDSNPEALLNSCKACGIDFLTDNCLMIATVIGEDSTPFFEQNSPKEAETEALIRFMIKSVLEELVGEKHVGYVIEISGTSICLVSLSHSAKQDQNWKSVSYEMIRITEKVRELFAERFGIKISFAISQVYNFPLELQCAFNEVKEIVDYIEFYGEKNTIIHSDSFYNTGSTCVSEMNSNLNLLRIVDGNVRLGNFDVVRMTVSQYIKTELLEKELPLQTAKLRASGLVNIVFDAILELRPNLDDMFLNELNPVGRLSQVKSIQDLQKQIQDIFTKLETYLENRRQEQNTAEEDEVIRYVKKHFHEVDLSVNKIAQEFNVSVAHLSRSFKKATGVGLLEYIHLIRIDEAKRMMREQKLSLQEITTRVGYGSRITLERAFKKYEGMSPGMFRDSEFA